MCDVYEIGPDRLLLIATDRLSAFDCILPTPIEQKGSILTALSAFWFRRLEHIVDHHLITTDLDEMPDEVRRFPELRGRSAPVKKTTVFPVECVVRGYLEGSGWKDYQATGSVCGHSLPEGLVQCDKLPAPLFTPATKAPAGHDENISEAEFASIVGNENAAALKTLSISIYEDAYTYALGRGIIIADTKFEFGVDDNGRILLIDEILTPDSSRFWAADKYSPGKARHRSTSSSFANIWRRLRGTSSRPPRRCRRKSPRRRPAVISMRTGCSPDKIFSRASRRVARPALSIII